MWYINVVEMKYVINVSYSDFVGFEESPGHFPSNNHSNKKTYKVYILIW